MKHDTATDDERRPTAIIGVVVVVLLLLLPLFYVLSIGPAIWLVQHEIVSESLLQPVYAPLGWLLSNSELAERIMSPYLEWWLEIGPVGF